ncbi:hypothetical protein DSO57_1005368 [Entomophthora muscae]|uniref:Uncharacterized protein n=1 Tax=Entomophthora muscae TaxID=34485 RepID=A0ACC2SA39_9FUNG|nr:hypothetical protein DSO57_1005368 [Entomophthora muscae]
MLRIMVGGIDQHGIVWEQERVFIFVGLSSSMLMRIPMVLTVGGVWCLSSADFMVGISYWGHLRCSGARYRHVVLATAYCVNRPRDGMAIHYGHLLMKSTKVAKINRIESEYGLGLGVVVIHPKVQLDNSPLELDTYSTNNMKMGSSLVLFGWGRNPKTNAQRQWLGQLNTTIFGLARCCKMLEIDLETEFCAGNKHSASLKCHMDLGSALVTSDRMTLVGLMTQSGDCQNRASPSAFFSIAKYQHWIDIEGLKPLSNATTNSAKNYYKNDLKLLEEQSNKTH